MVAALVGNMGEIVPLGTGDCGVKVRLWGERWGRMLDVKARTIPVPKT